jgi:hypothetical protein
MVRMADIVIASSKPRNLVAKDLRTPKYRMRVALSKKRYDRKKIKKVSYEIAERNDV